MGCLWQTACNNSLLRCYDMPGSLSQAREYTGGQGNIPFIVADNKQKKQISNLSSYDTSWEGKSNCRQEGGVDGAILTAPLREGSQVRGHLG